MSGRLQKELKQSRPFTSLQEEVFLNLVRTAGFLSRERDELFKAKGLSGEQYNVLRILRGAGKDGLPCSEIGARMVTRSPDITRLLDKLEARGLVGRTRSAEDRRVVTSVIAPPGLGLLAELDQPLKELGIRQLRHIKEGDLRKAVELLEEMRVE